MNIGEWHLTDVITKLPCGCVRRSNTHYDIVTRKGDNCKIALHEMDTCD